MEHACRREQGQEQTLGERGEARQSSCEAREALVERTNEGRAGWAGPAGAEAGAVRTRLP